MWGKIADAAAFMITTDNSFILYIYEVLKLQLKEKNKTLKQKYSISSPITHVNSISVYMVDWTLLIHSG